MSDPIARFAADQKALIDQTLTDGCMAIREAVAAVAAAAGSSHHQSLIDVAHNAGYQRALADVTELLDAIIDRPLS